LHSHSLSLSFSGAGSILSVLLTSEAVCARATSPWVSLKVPKHEIFDPSDFPDFYTIKSSWVGDMLVKILNYYFNC
jgi:hypothetical protein